MSELNRWLTVVSPAEMADVARDAEARGIFFYRISTRGAWGKDYFFRVARETFPLDPPVLTSNWDAFDDSLWEGLNNQSAEELLILWSGSADFSGRNASGFHTVISTLVGVAETLADARYNKDELKRVHIFVDSWIP